MTDHRPESSGPGDENKRPTSARIGVWIVVGAIGLYLIISGVWGLVTGS